MTALLVCRTREDVESRRVRGALKRSGRQSQIGADGCLMCMSTPSYFCKCDGDARNLDTHPMALVLKYPPQSEACLPNRWRACWCVPQLCSISWHIFSCFCFKMTKTSHWLKRSKEADTRTRTQTCTQTRFYVQPSKQLKRTSKSLVNILFSRHHQ